MEKDRVDGNKQASGGHSPSRYGATNLTGRKTAWHAEIREAVSKLIKVLDLRHISFSHFESDECGALNEWLGVAPKADVPA